VSVTVLVPVLARPHRVVPLLESIRDTSPEAKTLFICDTDDQDEIAAVDDAVHNFGERFVDYLTDDGGYAAKINAGLRYDVADLYFLGADDLEFQPGWLEAAFGPIDRGLAAVVGVNDLIPRNRDHATHFLVTSEYSKRGQTDGQPGVLHEGYHHWYCDDELIATARSRRAYTYAPSAKVRHLHPMVGAEDDDTYRKGRQNRQADKALFRRRSRQWM
jgi:glycosyltransferase involved in cell wall biosynthesis